jgi:hypothetical protein
MLDFPDCDFKIENVRCKYFTCSGFDDEGLPTFFVVEPFDIGVDNLEKRTRAMIDILKTPGKRNNKSYNRNQAINLANICKKKNRIDLADDISKNIK